LRKSGFAIVGMACLIAVGGLLIAATSASATWPIVKAADDPRGDMPDRPGTIVTGRYGANGSSVVPFHLPAASGGTPGQIHNVQITIPAPCTNCAITDMVPELVDLSGNPVGLSDGLVLHHFVILNPGKPDVTCGVFPGDRFFASGNERTHVHFPTGYGYVNNNGSWSMIVHLVNLRDTPSTGKDVFIEVLWRYRTDLNSVQPVTPVWLDVGGLCSASEYPAPVGYSDTHVSWTSTLTGRVVGASGHVHDIDYDDPNCVTHCASNGGGISVTAEVVGGNANDYFGPLPQPSHSGLTGATLCRSVAYYGTPYGITRMLGHLDTMSLCGVFTDTPWTAQPEAYAVNPTTPPTSSPAALPPLGYPIQSGQVIKLHSEYQNGTGATRNDVMGIMVLYVAQRTQQYARALKTSLVPAYRQTISNTQCTARGGLNGTHGLPLGLPSCNPPAFIPGTVAHVGAQSLGYAELVAVPGDLGTGTDEADVAIQGTTTDIRSGSATGADYDPVPAGDDATLITRWRISDNYNGASLTDPATVQDFDFKVPVNCTATSDPSVGSTCNVDTTADSLTAGEIKEGKAMTIQLFRIVLNDAGANGTRGDADDRIFEQQGLYNP
jgi:hypothetical protein